MKRWNGWGHSSVTAELKKSARALLHEVVGTGGQVADAALDEVLSKVPPSGLPSHRLLDASEETRLRHARGQSLGDWLELRYGEVNSFPDAVAFPQTTAELRDVLAYAHTEKANVIPYGGGTSVVGHLTPSGDRPVLTVSLARMNQLIHWNPDDHLATFQAGIAGPDLEASLRATGYTLGHFPQSFEFSTLGGWVVTRSSGQQSLGYGRIEDMFAGGLLLAPAGELEMPTLAASAAGPDLRQVVLGSEGRAGILAEATVRVRPLAQWEYVAAVLLPGWETGVDLVRHLTRSELCLSMMRLSDPEETKVQLGLSGLKVPGSGCLLLLAFTSASRLTFLRDRLRALALCVKAKGVPLPGLVGRGWKKKRFRGAYLRNTLWSLGYAVDTLETCLSWSSLGPAKEEIEGAIKAALGAEGLVFSHLSHFYSSGCSLYTTYVFPLRSSYGENLDLWRKAKGGASGAIVRHGGTISHQHGVGLDHKPYLVAEKGELGIDSLKGALSSFDPEGRMNPGKLL